MIYHVVLDVLQDVKVVANQLVPVDVVAVVLAIVAENVMAHVVVPVAMVAQVVAQVGTSSLFIDERE